jgi:hypothetical protein
VVKARTLPSRSATSPTDAHLHALSQRRPMRHLDRYFDRSGKLERCRRHLYGLAVTVYEGLLIGLMAVLEYPRDLSEGPFDEVEVQIASACRPSRLSQRRIASGCTFSDQRMLSQMRHERDVINIYITTSRDGVLRSRSTARGRRGCLPIPSAWAPNVHESSTDSTSVWKPRPTRRLLCFGALTFCLVQPCFVPHARRDLGLAVDI